MPANIDTAVLPLGGRGTRMLPLTKAIPKEMLPVFDAPVIWKIATELGSSGVRRLVLVVPPGPSITADFFARDAALEKDLRSKGAGEVADMMAQIGRQFAVEVARQPQPKGDGDALLRGAQLAGADECFVYFGDELLHGKTASGSQLLAHHQRGTASLGVWEVPPEEQSLFGIVAPKNPADADAECFWVETVVEKPPAGLSPGRHALVGKAIIPSAVVELLAQMQPTTGGELRLADALAAAAARGSPRLRAVQLRGNRFDVGRPEGLLAAANYFASL